MTLVELRKTIDEKIVEFTTEKMAETPDAAKLAGIKKDLDDAVVKAQDLRTDEVNASILSSVNPMFAAATLYRYEVDDIDEVKNATGDVVGFKHVQKVIRVDVSKITKETRTLAAQKGSTIVKTGVAVNGDAWIHCTERLANALAYLKASEHGANDERLNQIKTQYRLSDGTEKDSRGVTPTMSKTKMADALQEIIDLMVFIPGNHGANAIKVTGFDAAHVLDSFIKPGKNPGEMKQLKARGMINLVFEVVHCIVSDTAYNTNPTLKKDVKYAEQPSRNKHNKLNHPICIDEEGNLIPDVPEQNAAEHAEQVQKVAKKGKKAEKAPAATEPAADNVNN